MKILKPLLTGVPITITLLICFFLTTILLSFIYGLDEALLTF